MRRFLASLAAVLLPAAAWAGLEGTIADGQYHAPLNNYSIVLPKLREMVIHDAKDPYGGRVAFSEPTGRFVLVDHMRLPDHVVATLATPEKRDELYRVFVSKQALESARRHSPRTAVLKEAFIDAQGSRAYFVILNIPEAGDLVDTRTRRRLDSVRGLLVLEQNGFLYMLGCELNYAGHQTDASSLDAGQVEDAQATLKKIKESMTFR